MKKLRFIIAIVLIFSLLPVFGVSAEEQQIKGITETETYAFKKLEAFGLVSESDHLFYYENVKRSIFMSYVMKCIPGYSENAASGIKNPFSDVDDTTYGTNAILTAAQIGLINGAEGSEFRPNDSITKSEAAKVLVSMLGYSDYAEMKGGYPSGYLAMAKSLGIFDGCEFTPEGYFTISDFLKAFGNVLDTEVLQTYAITIDPSGKIITLDYESLEDRTLLYYAFDIYEAEGIVKANEYASVYSKSNLEKDEVMINGYVYKTKDDAPASLLGYNTHYYYKKDRDAVHGEIVYIEPYRNNVVATVTNNIAKDAVTDTNFRYYPDENSNKYQDLKIAKNIATLIHNGEQKPLTKELLCPTNGTVTLIDNNEDNVVDVVFVMDYRTIMISSVSSLTYQIMDSFGGKSITLDPKAEEYDVMLEIKQPVNRDNEEYYVTYGLYGEYLPPVKNEFSELKIGDIILYAESKNNNKNIKYVKVSRDIKKGTVTSIYKDYITIDDERYELSPDSTLKLEISVGESGTFYLDAFGRIVAKSLENNVVYGYLNGIDMDDSGFGDLVRVKIFSEYDRWVVLELANKVKSNIKGDTTVFNMLTPKDVYDTLNAMPDFRQLVTYTINKEGKVNNITIAQNVEAYSDDEKKAIDEDTFRAVYSSDWGTSSTNLIIEKQADDKRVRLLTSVGRALGYTEIQIDDTTKIFFICEDDENLTHIEASSQMSQLIGTGLIPYDMKDNRVAGAVVVPLPKGTINAYYGLPVVIVDEVIETINSAGDQVSGILGICEGEPITLVASASSLSGVINQLNRGDIIQVALDKNGEIYDNPPTDLDGGDEKDNEETARFAIKRRFSIKNKNLRPLDVTNTENGAYGRVFTVEYVDALNTRMLVKGKDNKRTMVKPSGTTTKYYVCDEETETLTVGSFADLSKGAFCFGMGSLPNFSTIVIYKPKQ